MPNKSPVLGSYPTAYCGLGTRVSFKYHTGNGTLPRHVSLVVVLWAISIATVVSADFQNGSVCIDKQIMIFSCIDLHK